MKNIYTEWEGWLHLDGWMGGLKQEIVIVGETGKKYKIRSKGDIKVCLAGRGRYLNPGDTVLVPKYAVTKRED